MFDNGSTPPKEKQSRGLLLKPDTAGHTVTLVKAFTNPSRTLLAASQGNTLSLPGGNWLMGYGGLPNFTEYDASGHVLLDGTLGKNVQDFRTYLAPWSATAPGRPSLSAKVAGGAATVAVELERRDLGCLVARAGGSVLGLAGAGRDHRQGGLRDDAEGEHGGPLLRRAGA